MPSRNCFVR